MPFWDEGTGSRLACMLIGALVVVSGCNSSPPNEYRSIQQVADTSSQSDERVPPPADAMHTENAAMMSVRPEVSLASFEPVSAVAVANPRKAELLVPHKVFPKDRKTGALRLAFDDVNLLTVLNMDPVTDDAVTWMPGWMTALDGQMVRVRGYMLFTFQQDGLEQFVLLRDNQECCFGPTARIYDHMQILMKAGTTANYVPIQESLDVVGRFKIDLQATESSVYGLYVIEDAMIVPR